MKTKGQDNLLPVPAGGEALQSGQVRLWPEAVDGAEVLEAVRSALEKHLVLPAGAADAIALWVPTTFCPRSFLHSPRLAFCSPEPGCGKTTALELLRCLVALPILTASPTEASLSRLIHAYQPTLLLDEYDAWLTEAKAIVTLLNAGHRQGQARLRCCGPNGVQAFNVYGPVALGGIGELPPTLRSRSLVVRMTRPKLSEAREPFDIRDAGTELIVRPQLARWASDNQTRLLRCRPALPPGAINRRADNWSPPVRGGRGCRRCLARQS